MANSTTISKSSTIIFDQPNVPLVSSEVYQSVLSKKLPLTEITAMVIFLEYFSEPAEKEYLVSDYLESIYKRFKDYDVGGMHLKKIPRHLLSIGIPLDFSVQMYEHDYARPWTYEQRLYAFYRRKEMAIMYNGLSEKITELYMSIKNYYEASTFFKNLMKKLQAQYIGYFPKVSLYSNDCFTLTFIEQSMV